MKRTLVLVASLTLAAAAHAGARPGDVRVLSPEGAARAWTPTTAVAPAYPADLAARGISGCVTVTYLIGADGRVSDVRLLDGLASPRSPVAQRVALDDFASASAAALYATRFDAVSDARPTVTAATMHFGDDGGAMCAGTNTARLIESGRSWDAVLEAQALRVRTAMVSADLKGRDSYSDIARAMDSPRDGTQQVIFSPPSVVVGGR